MGVTFVILVELNVNILLYTYESNMVKIKSRHEEIERHQFMMQRRSQKNFVVTIQLTKFYFYKRIFPNEIVIITKGKFYNKVQNFIT